MSYYTVRAYEGSGLRWAKPFDTERAAQRAAAAASREGESGFAVVYLGRRVVAS